MSTIRFIVTEAIALVGLGLFVFGAALAVVLIGG